MQVSLLDAVGNLLQTTNQQVTISPVALEPDPAISGDEALVIGCPPCGKMVISTTSAGGIAVTINNASQSVPPSALPLGHIVVYGQGSDTIQEFAAGAGGPVAIPAIILGGSGASNLSAAGSNAANVLVGGPGNDMLTDGTSADILIGGGGANSLTTGKGGDILIGSTTTSDANVAALAAMTAEWGSTDSYEQRVEELFATSLNPATVLRNTAVNQLTGSGGQDWFWLSAHSVVKDYGAGDAATFE